MQSVAGGNDFGLKSGTLKCRCRGATLAAILTGEAHVTTRRSVLDPFDRRCSPALALPRGAFAQAFPTKPIKIIVPFPPGGPADTAVRIAQGGMEKSLGQPVIVENVAGRGRRARRAARQAVRAGRLHAPAGREPAHHQRRGEAAGQRRSHSRLRSDRPDRQQRLHALRQQGAGPGDARPMSSPGPRPSPAN